MRSTQTLVEIYNDVTSNEFIAGNGKIPERSVIQVSTYKNDIKVQYLYDIMFNMKSPHVQLVLCL